MSKGADNNTSCNFGLVLILDNHALYYEQMSINNLRTCLISMALTAANLSLNFNQLLN